MKIIDIKIRKYTGFTFINTCTVFLEKNNSFVMDINTGTNQYGIRTVTKEGKQEDICIILQFNSLIQAITYVMKTYYNDRDKKDKENKTS